MRAMACGSIPADKSSMARRAKQTYQVEQFATGGHIHWEVRWVTLKNGDYAIHVKDCAHDLTMAVSIYSRVKQAKRRFVTLRSCNVGFAPPAKYQPYWVTKKKKERTSRNKVITVPHHVRKLPMKPLNNKGIYWCPYCREMRRFQTQKGFVIDGIVVPEKGMFCPICGVRETDYHVRKWNPLMEKLFYRGG